MLAADLPHADRDAVDPILVLTSRLESLRLLLFLLVALLMAGQ